jgi:hypothetical protein
MPKPEAFTTPDAYAVTALHELTHWTGHESRLKREFGKRFRDQAHSNRDYDTDASARGPRPPCRGGLHPLGGSPTALSNLALQDLQEAREKDRLEVRLQHLVCHGEIALVEARDCIARDWLACSAEWMSAARTGHMMASQRRAGIRSDKRPRH